LASLFSDYCGAGGFSITSALSGEEGIRLARQQHFLLVIHDVMLPGIDGFEVLKRLRRSSDTPILMLTTSGAALDRVHGLENGADDYLAMPFQPEELVLRVKSILQRAHPKDGPTKLTIGDLIVDESERSIRLSGQRLELTEAEFSLISLLLAQPGEPLPREELIPRIFGREPTGLDRSFDTLVRTFA
jgi:two-component system, OmpR family, response regulator CpxR